MKSTQDLFNSYKEKMRKVADIRYANAVLQWDQETYMPPKSAEFRGQQISTLSELSHQLFIDPELGNLLEELLSKSDLDLHQKRNVERTKEDYDKSKKYTPAFVRALSEQVNKTFHAWLEARKQNSFAVFKDDLTALIKLKREEADIVGFKEHPYDALLDEYEKGATVSMLDKLFANLLPSLSELFNQIASKPQVDDSFLKQSFDKDHQWKWGMHLLKEMQFDFSHGRQDISEHPFSVSFNPEDVRITTRISEHDFTNMTWSCIHELGHAFYEQGLPVDQYGLPLGEACSYSIHESQSRLWENCVGRSLNFCEHYFPQVKTFFPEQFSSVDATQFFKAINKVEPSLIRTEADEITYHFHVFIRYEMEKQLIDGSISASDIPGFWDDKYKQYLKVDVPDDKSGCLQDVHWSHGNFGYFPTYSLGSFYAAQLFRKAGDDIPELDNEIKNGETLNLLQWLRVNVHKKGRFYTSEELVENITGEKLNVTYFMDYLSKKFSKIYT